MKTHTQTDRLSALFGVTSKAWGGNEKWAFEAARGLAARGHRVRVLWTYEPVGERLGEYGLDGIRIRLWGDLNPVGFFSLVSVVRAEAPDVLVLTKEREYWMGGLGARLAGRPLVVLRQGLARPLVDDVKRRLAFGRLSDFVVVNSEWVKGELVKSDWIDPSKLRVVYNGVSTDPVDRASSLGVRASLGIPAEARIVCGIGRLVRQKGFDILIDAFRTVSDEIDSCVLLIVGEGNRRGELEERVRARGLDGLVHMPGHRQDIREILSTVDVFTLSSRFEGMANALLEAMSVGAPIVATDISGTREAVRDRVEGLVVPPEDAGALSGGILELLRHDGVAAEMGRAALKRARERFVTSRMVSDLEDLLYEGLASRGTVTTGA